MKNRHLQTNFRRNKVSSIAVWGIATGFAGMLVTGIALASSTARPAVSASAAAPTAVPAVEKAVVPQSVKSLATATPFSDVSRPSGPFIANPQGGTVNGVAYDCILTNGSFTLTQPLKGRVLVTGKAVLYIPKTGSIQFAPTDRITVANGARLSLYSDSSADAVFGNLTNESGDASNFNYFGLEATGNSEVAFRVEPRFCGCIFAPHQRLALIGNASEDKDFTGAVVAREVTMRDATN